NSLNKTILNDTALQSGVDHPLKEDDRISIGGVVFVYHAVEPPKAKAPQPPDGFMVVTESDAGEHPDFRTLEASRSSAMVSAVHPEVKLKAILEITRALSNELRIDTVAPKILDSLMVIFPSAERLFLMLQDPSSKRLVRKAFQYRPQKRTLFTRTVPEDEVPARISRTIVDFVLGQKKSVMRQEDGADTHHA